MPFHFSSGISVFIIEHVPGFFSMRHSLTSLTLDLLLLLLTCHASPQKKSENKCNVSSDFFTVEVRVEVFPPLYYTAELLAVGTYANAQYYQLARQLVVNLATFSQTASSQEPYFQQAYKKGELFQKFAENQLNQRQS